MVRTLEQLPVAVLDVDPVNPRPEAGDVDDLAASIADLGVLNPLLVRPAGGGRYGVLSGQRRLAASRQVGLDTVPVLVFDVDDDLEALAIATAENVGRRAMDPVAEAQAFRRMVDGGMTQLQVAERIGCSDATVSVRLQLLDECTDDELEQLRTGELGIWKAYEKVKRRRARRTGTTRKPRPKRTRQSQSGDVACHHAAPHGHDLVPLPRATITAAVKAARELGVTRDRYIAAALDAYTGKVLERVP